MNKKLKNNSIYFKKKYLLEKFEIFTVIFAEKYILILIKYT